MGGGAMRTAAKAAVFAGYRSTAARRASNLPSSASASSTVHVSIEGEPAPLIPSISSERSPAVIQRPVWELDEWELAGGKEEEEMLMDPPPRLVFGPVPTMEEAKEATADLKEAVEKAYFFSSTAGDAVKVGQSCGESEAILPKMHSHVVQAFSLLQGSPEAQSVVASLACDKNVWEAVMKNEKVMEFYTRQQFVAPLESNIDPEEESTGENESLKESTETVHSPDKETSGISSYFTDVVQGIKLKVSKMVSNISEFLQDIMGPSSESTTNTKTSTKTSTIMPENYTEVAVGASFIALAIAVILVVLLKRG